ncbi:hypothetical protein CBZ_14010 [Cellulomonas biazotea]|uniref:Uncharacterized protein n=1 Tax=Cellulomonas biazotea TaxID=1709 RepID=A0A402DQF4_9CELL|nr:hypothetical protein CBZ_14010 [Cellulomonas biazotea]
MSQSVLAAIVDEAAHGGDLETGGILLGHDRPRLNETHIVTAGGPGPLATRSARFFYAI